MRIAVVSISLSLILVAGAVPASAQDDAEAGSPVALCTRIVTTGPLEGTDPVIIELAALAEKSEDARGLDGLDRAAKRLKKWAKRQISWLDRHPPEACYAEAHAQWRHGLVSVRNGAKAVRTSVRSLRPEPMRRAVRQLAAGTLDLSGVDLDVMARDCVEAARSD